MDEIRLGMVEAVFADIVWENAPLTTKELVTLCEKPPLNWKRTTTYTVLKKLCLRGIFRTENSTVTVQITRDRFHAIISQQFVAENFSGSLPAFLAAFTSGKAPTTEELSQIRKLLDHYGEAGK